MKKIINGRKYDTDTANFVGYWSNGYTPGDFNYCREELYRKKNGEFFLYGYGGAMSRYSERCGSNSWCGGEDITPLTVKDARFLAEKNLDADKYEMIFGEVSEDKNPSIILSGTVATRLNQLAAESGVDAVTYLKQLLA